jgi:hypothetical protein
MAELTPLDGIAGFDETLRSALAEFWIGSAEEFVSVARADNATHGKGFRALALQLGVAEDRVRELFNAAEAVLPPDFPFATLDETFEAGAGAIFDDIDDIEPSFAGPVEVPLEVPPLGKLPAAVNQGNRNSCVAFTLAAIYQALSGDSTDLSEQFLYWAAKQRDGIRGDHGTNPVVALQVFQEQGICSEVAWPYLGTQLPDKDDNPGQGPAPAAALAEAQLRRITGFEQVPAKDVNALQAKLAEGKPLLIGLHIWQHWGNSYQGKVLGKVRRALPGEQRNGGHAMCVVGYRPDDSAPGGGYFIVRNSWGTGWATDNPDGPGYCHVPYRLMLESGLAAFAVSGVTPPPALGAASVEALPATPSVNALLAEAREIQQRVNALVEALSRLV